MNEKKQIRLINNLLNSPDLVGRCIEIIKPSYFEPDLVPDVKFLINYHLKHNANPSINLMNAESMNDDLYQEEQITIDEIDYCAGELEEFCKQSAMRDAIFESYELVQENKFGEIYKKVSEALGVTLKKDLGLNVFENPEEVLARLMEEVNYISCGISTLDEPLGGGTLRKQFYMLSANSGGGKSVVLSNLANNYALQGLDVCYISLELPPDMIFLRQAFIMTEHSHRIWKTKVLEIAEKMHEFKKYGAGDFRITRLPIGSTANSIRAYIKQYEIEMKKPPDVLIVDYLDLLSPIGGVKNKGLSEQDREKSQEIYELLHAYDMIGWSASQQNREALKMSSPDHSAIAGGMSKIDICDAWISLFMDSGMRLNGTMLAYFLKTRYSDGHGKKIALAFDNGSLKVSNHEKPDSVESLLQNIGINKKTKSKSKESKFLNKLVAEGELALPNLDDEENKKLSKKVEQLRETVVDFSDEDDTEDDNEDLLAYMDSLQIGD